MANLNLKYGLPFCTIKLSYKSKSISIDNVLLDTGSGGTVFKMDIVDKIGITIEVDDIIETISGIGGSEFVYKKDVDSIILGDMELKNFKIEVGVMDYGFDINGIIGMDFLKEVGAIINLDEMKVTKDSR
ncbi:retroviral-like aspartic protease family protein [Tissierella sp. MSJ-40]|uniref:Retroviral-like aspartic protease family protein n=1 Tax=Tissierella simiarum TaxID=2841534 RepID=A0ABS6E4H8_9FIRM|nr:retropepsin-like aspartic protease [Tissierella simiarum]MBU5437154.1 retroviral-like aspartic protease family protein [Tissierella simiarum]